MFCKKLIVVVLLFSPLVGCTPQEMYENEHVKEAQVTDRTRAGTILENLPPSSEKVAVSLYDFQDMTGQFKNNDKYSDFSSAVTKGGLSILTKALLDAGNKKWFTVTERGGLKDLLQERQIIKVMRSEYRTPDGQKLPELPPLIYGGMLLQGGIVGYDSNVVTGGAGALYLGLGANAKYARDVVTVYLRAVSIQTGEVLLSVTSSKTIYSTSVDTNVLKYITFDRLLQAEAGFSLNEPVQLATRQAIETSVYSMIMEGAIEGLWDFKDKAAGQRAIAEYIARRDGAPQDQPANDKDMFQKSMIGGGAQQSQQQPQMPVQQPMAAAPRENPIATPAQTIPVVSENLPPPQPMQQQAMQQRPVPVQQPMPAPMPVAQQQPVAPVQQQAQQVQPDVVIVPATAQPVMAQPAAAQPVQAQAQPVQQPVPVVRNRGFEPQLAPENGPISQNIPAQASPQVAAQMAALQPAAGPVTQDGPSTAAGWGYDAVQQPAAASNVVPVAYQQPMTASERQRPLQNGLPVYY